MSDEEDKQAHDFAISVLNDYLNKRSLKSNLDDLLELSDGNSNLFAIYYVAYYGFQRSLKHQKKENFQARLTLLAEKLHLK